jgi:glutaredoxin
MTTYRHWGAVAAATLLACAPAWALYKVIGPDGKVTYTDRPPVDSSAGKAVPVDASGRPVSSDASLPYELRQVASRFPVTLYSTPGCQPCDLGRSLLRQRGIPFQERESSTSADQQAWQQRFGSLEAPVLTIGSQQVRGFSPESWNNYLDVAGYPRESKLPPTYAQAASQPLTERPPAAAPAEGRPQRPAAAAPPPPEPSASGFRF